MKKAIAIIAIMSMSGVAFAGSWWPTPESQVQSTYGKVFATATEATANCNFSMGDHVSAVFTSSTSFPYFTVVGYECLQGQLAPGGNN